MEQLKQELEQWLPEQFPGARLSFDDGRPGAKLSGILTWPGFNGLEPIDRQGLLWRAIRTRFDREDQLGISSIITLTPAKYAVYLEPQMA